MGGEGSHYCASAILTPHFRLVNRITLDTVSLQLYFFFYFYFFFSWRNANFDFFLGPPELIPLCPPVIHVIEGMDLHIDATVHGYPYPWVTWSHNKVLIGNKSIENNETSHIIRNVTVYEGGSYSCFANNRYGAVLFTVNVYVQGIDFIRI